MSDIDSLIGELLQDLSNADFCFCRRRMPSNKGLWIYENRYSYWIPREILLVEHNGRHAAFRRYATADELLPPRTRLAGEFFIDRLIFRRGQRLFQKDGSEGEIWWDIEIEPLIQKRAVFRGVSVTISKIPRDAIEKAGAILKDKEEYEIEA
jgi:hypothetical protein